MDADQTGTPQGGAARVRRHKYFAQQNPGAGAIHLLRACPIPLGVERPQGAEPQNKTIRQRQMVLFLVRAWGLEPQRRKAREPKGDVTSVKDYYVPLFFWRKNLKHNRKLLIIASVSMPRFG